MNFKSYRWGRWRWQVAEEYYDIFPEIASLCANIEEAEPARIISARSNEIWLELRAEHKGFSEPLWARVIEHSLPNAFFWRKPPLQSIFKKSIAIYEKMTCVPKPVAYGFKTKRLGGEREIFIFESLNHYRSLPLYLRENFIPKEVEFHPLEKRKRLAEILEQFERILKAGIIPKPDAELEQVFYRIEKERFNIIFSQPEFLNLYSFAGKKQEQEFLAWLAFQLKPYLSRTYWMRFFRIYCSKKEPAGIHISPFLKELSNFSKKIAQKQVRKEEEAIWRKKEPYFWFVWRGYRVFLYQVIDQNQVIKILPELGFLSRKGSKIRLKLKGKREPEECDLVAVEEDRRQKLTARDAFFLAPFLRIYGIPFQTPLMAVESLSAQSGSYLIYEPLSSSAMSLSEYLARLLADELSGKSWDRRFLLRLAHFLIEVFRLGLIFQKPRGDEIWVEESAEGERFYLSHLERIKKLKKINIAELKNALFELLGSLLLPESDAFLVLEEFIRHFEGFKERRKELLFEFQIYFREISR